LVFGPEITEESVTLTRQGNDLLITIDGTSDSIFIEGQFETSGYNQYLQWKMVERIAFANGVVWEPEDIRTVLIDENSTPGDDIIRGFWSDDVIDGGAGDDELRGSSGSDTYHYGMGSGHDVIYEALEHHPFLEGEDTIEFGEGIAFDDLSYTRDSGDLVFTILQTNSRNPSARD